MEIVLYDRELEVMQVLWDRGPSTVAEVRDAIPDEMAYTTVLTVLRRLEEKGYAGHEEEGRAHRYFPRVQRQQVRESAVERLLGRLFQGSPELLLTHLVSGRGLSEAELRRLRDLVDGRLEKEP
ncbi:MAG TPA: BlaI/MecI/CopY family transcriptional regulator [Longimicrobium sp.]|jgi:predicted transcriptional regulator